MASSSIELQMQAPVASDLSAFQIESQALKADFIAQNARYFEMQSMHQALQSALDASKAHYAALQSHFTDLQSVHTTLESDFAALKASQAAPQADLRVPADSGSSTSLLADVSAQHDTSSTQLADTSTRIGAAQSREHQNQGAHYKAYHASV